MADNVAITAGAGTSIATDDVGGVQFQRVKATWGADGTANDTSDTNPLPTSPRNPTFDTGLVTIPGVVAAAYAAGDQLGTIISFPNATRATGGTGWINSILYYDMDNVMGAVDIVFFDQSATLAGGDNGVFSLADTEIIKILAVVPLQSMMTFSNSRYGQLTGLQIGYSLAAGGSTLYASVIQRTAPTLATGSASTPPSQRMRLLLTRD